MMTYEECVGFYESRTRFGIRPGLERINALLHALGDPHKGLKAIHVAGTNGKGTVCLFLQNILTRAGYKTGLFISPYISDFRERIQTDGVMISKSDLISVTRRVKDALESLPCDVDVTEFEAITAAAFLYYKEIGCDIAVLETGLGGRFDATNVIEDPLVCVITSVSFDHMGVLGHSLTQIAGEKCGIIKPGCKVVSSPAQFPEVIDVIKAVCLEREAELCVPDEPAVVSGDIAGSVMEYRGVRFRVPFPGAHQARNAVTAIEAIRAIGKLGYPVGDEALTAGIAGAENPARTEIISRSPLVILDGSHNTGSVEALRALVREYLKDKDITAVVSMMADKQVEDCLEKILPLCGRAVCTKASNPRAEEAEGLAAIARRYCTDVSVEPDPFEACLKGIAAAGEDGVALIFGSLYFAGDVRDRLIARFNKADS